MKTWKRIEWGDECPKCGAGVEILTDAPEGLGGDGDEARCAECGHEGWVAVADIDEACINWQEDDPANSETNPKEPKP